MLYFSGEGPDTEEEVWGRTRLMKEIFLVDRYLNEKGMKTDLEFEPYLYGPCDNEILNLLDELVEREHVSPGKRGEVGKYSVRMEGIRATQNLSFKDLEEGAFRRIKRKFNYMPQDELIKHVYENYPSFARESQRGRFENRVKNLDTFSIGLPEPTDLWIYFITDVRFITDEGKYWTIEKRLLKFERERNGINVQILSRDKYPSVCNTFQEHFNVSSIPFLIFSRGKLGIERGETKVKITEEPEYVLLEKGGITDTLCADTDKLDEFLVNLHGCIVKEEDLESSVYGLKWDYYTGKAKEAIKNLVSVNIAP